MRNENHSRRIADWRPTSSCRLRYKRTVFEAFPSCSPYPPPRAPQLAASTDRVQWGPPQRSLKGTDPPSHIGSSALTNNPTSAGISSAPATPWDSSLSEGLDFCRDGEALLLHLKHRIHATGDQLSAACKDTAGKGGEEKETEHEARESDTSEKLEQQRLLEEEVDECLAEIEELRRLLISVRSFMKATPLLSSVDEGNSTSNRSQGGGLRGEAAFKIMKLFGVNQVIESYAAPPASAIIGVLRRVKQLVAALAERIHNVENSASIWLTHGGEVIPYLQHLRQSLRELKTQHQNSTEKRQELAARVAQKRQQMETVRFRLEKTQDEFRLARIDLTRDELEKISGKERMQLLESKREALDAELKSLAAFSPLFIVERAAKYITLQYRPENSSTDHEISIEGLDLSFTRGITRISPFFCVHVQPNNSRVRLLLESGIGDLLQKLSASHAALKVQNMAVEEQVERGIHAADDVVVDHIAAVLIKALSSSFTTPNLPPLCVPPNSACHTVEA